MDIVVGKTSFSRCKSSLSPNGYYLAVAGGLNDLLQMIRTSVTGGKKAVFGGGANCEKLENFEQINALIKNGKLHPVVDKVFPFEQLVDAHHYVEARRKRGNVVVTVNTSIN